ncbi:MAG: hypothetical protein MZV70_62640 [Desulfobacterales bacterium]|nr:hypothetical protein [Desulfobacterales bacterium]
MERIQRTRLYGRGNPASGSRASCRTGTTRTAGSGASTAPRAGRAR